MKRRSFFGMLAGLFCLPLVKPKQKHKFFDIPDGCEVIMVQRFGSQYHIVRVNCEQ